MKPEIITGYMNHDSLFKELVFGGLPGALRFYRDVHLVRVALLDSPQMYQLRFVPRIDEHIQNGHIEFGSLVIFHRLKHQALIDVVQIKLVVGF